MTDSHLDDRGHGLERLEHWLERHERVWIPTAALAVIAIWAFAALSVTHSNAVKLRNTTSPVSADWSITPGV